MSAVMRVLLSIALTASAGVVLAHPYIAPAPGAFSTTKLSERLYIVHGGSGHGSHVGVCVGDEGLLLIDSMLEGSADPLDAALASISDKPVELIINTHHHSDHTGGNAHFASRGAVSISHPSSRFTPVEGDLKIRQAKLEYCGEEISIYPLVAHTHDDLIVHFESSNVLFLGDTFANAWHPTGFARGLDSEMATIFLALSLSNDKTVIVPGHGLLDSIAGIERYLLLNENWYARLATLTDASLSPEEMAHDQKLIELRDQFVAGREPRIMPPDRFLRFIRQSLAAQFPPRSDVPQSAMSDYVGIYQVRDGEPVEVTVRADYLLARQRGAFIAELVPVGTDTFQIRGNPESEVKFARGRCIVPNKVTLREGDFSLVAERGSDCP